MFHDCHSLIVFKNLEVNHIQHEKQISGKLQISVISYFDHILPQKHFYNLFQIHRPRDLYHGQAQPL